jgi:acetylornithine deacetylase/succinyl-diaminopimelate desuccinylase-like protein
MRAILSLLLLTSLASADETRDLLAELVAIDTTNPPGDEEKVARLVAARLEKAGVKAEVVPFGNGRANVIARLKGDGTRKPLLLLAHEDVVGATGQPWTVPPFQLTEKDGWLYGRGVQDDKGWAACAVSVFLELARSKAKLHRDVVLALTGDEESGGEGIKQVLAKRPELLGDVELSLNEGGTIRLDASGKPILVLYQPSEKIYNDFELTANGLGGHSSVPNDENAIYRLARALDKLAAYRFAVRLTPAIRDSLRATAAGQPADRAKALRAVADAKEAPPADALAIVDAYPLTRAMVRTTCVATKLKGGTRENALPVEAKATVNCRILAADGPAEIKKALDAMMAPEKVSVKLVKDNGSGPDVPNEGVVVDAIKKVAREQLGTGVTISASVGLGATDSRYLRQKGVQAYGIGLLAKPEELIRAPHGPDEGVPAASLARGVKFLRALVHKLAE